MTFVRVQGDAVLVTPLQNLSHVLQVGAVLSVVRQDVVHHLAGVRDVSQGGITSLVVHVPGADDAHRRSLVPEPAPRRYKTRQVLILLSDWDLVIPGLAVQLGEEGGAG